MVYCIDESVPPNDQRIALTGACVPSHSLAARE